MKEKSEKTVGGGEGPGSLIRPPPPHDGGTLSDHCLTRAAALAGKNPMVAAQNIKRLIRFLSQRPKPPLPTTT